MADRGAVYRGRLGVADADAHRYFALDIATALHPSETLERLALRILAIGLFGDTNWRFRAGVCDGEAPELGAWDAAGRLTHWVDVGTPPLERLRAAAREERSVGVLTHSGLLERWQRQHRGSLVLEPNWRVLVLEAAFVAEAARRLTPRWAWQLTVSGGVLYLDTGGSNLSSGLGAPAGGD